MRCSLHSRKPIHVCCSSCFRATPYVTSMTKRDSTCVRVKICKLLIRSQRCQTCAINRTARQVSLLDPDKQRVANSSDEEGVTCKRFLPRAAKGTLDEVDDAVKHRCKRHGKCKTHRSDKILKRPKTCRHQSVCFLTLSGRQNSFHTLALRLTDDISMHLQVHALW